MLQHLTGRVCPPLPLPRPAATAVIDGQGSRGDCELNVTWRLTARQCSCSRPYAHSIWLKWRRCEWASVSYCHGAGWMQWPRPRLPDRSFRYTDLLRAGVRIIHRSTDFTLWQKSKVGVRIIFDGVLYSKFYGKRLDITSQNSYTLHYYTCQIIYGCYCFHLSLSLGYDLTWLGVDLCTSWYGYDLTRVRLGKVRLDLKPCKLPQHDSDSNYS